MKITEAKYGRRYNLGSYEHEELSLLAVLDEGTLKEATKVLGDLKAAIAKAHDEETASEDSEAEEAEEVKPAKKGKTKPVEKEEEETEEEEEEASEEEEEDNGPKEEEEEEEKPTTKKGKAKKPQPYDRDNAGHKTLFSSLLKEVSPGWAAKDATKKLAKEASANLEGEDFLDENGEVLETFKASVKKAMTAKKK